jgi:LPLT family lysophospholipid transporter-like MFS transporter
MPKGFYLLIAAQFASALADNALLIVAIALLEVHGLPGWWAPMLRFFFVASYVVLAPFVGPLADAVPKAHLMAWMNATKALGVLAMLAAAHPAFAFGVVGLAAAAYAPAKYGLVTEMVPSERLVAANGWIEISAVGAVLIGAVLGGFLVSDHMQALDAVLNAALLARSPDPGAGVPYLASLVLLLGIYALAGALNIRVPPSGARYPRPALGVARLVRDFQATNRTLWRDREGGLSLAVTTMLWGVAATLQFAVLRWAVDVLGLPLAHAAYLQGTVAVGVVIGAGVAGRSVRIEWVHRLLPAGVLLGLLVLSVTFIDRVALAIPVLLAVGALGGFLLVPMNALLQHRGFRLLSAGRSIAVQGFNENLSVLISLGLYTLVVAAGAPIVGVMVGFGIAVSIGLAVLLLRWQAALDARPRGTPVIVSGDVRLRAQQLGAPHERPDADGREKQ